MPNVRPFLITNLGAVYGVLHTGSIAAARRGAEIGWGPRPASMRWEATDIRLELERSIDALADGDYGDAADARDGLWHTIRLDATKCRVSVLTQPRGNQVGVRARGVPLTSFRAGVTPESMADACRRALPKIEALCVSILTVDPGYVGHVDWEHELGAHLQYRDDPCDYCVQHAEQTTGLAHAGRAEFSAIWLDESGDSDDSVYRICGECLAAGAPGGPGFVEVKGDNADERHCHGCDRVIDRHAPERVVYCGQCGVAS